MELYTGPCLDEVGEFGVPCNGDSESFPQFHKYLFTETCGRMAEAYSHAINFSSIDWNIPNCTKHGQSKVGSIERKLREKVSMLEKLVGSHSVVKFSSLLIRH
jgi:hypothetical protein